MAVEHMRERALSRLRAATSYWLATTRPDGRPHSMPVWGVLVGDELWFGTGGQKVRNLHHQPYAVAHHESAEDVAIIEGVVERRAFEDAPEAVVAAFAAKYVNPESGEPFDLLAGEAPEGEEVWLYSLRIRVGHAWLEGAFVETQTRWESDAEA
jgi:hypothetical protein